MNYWLVGANWSGDDQADVFFRRGYWELGWDDSEQPSMAQKRDNIKPNYRIAVKSMRGKGSSTITIRALGIVKEVGTDKRVYINWLIMDMDREVPSKGGFGSIHGPYTINTDTEWIREVFCI